MIFGEKIELKVYVNQHDFVSDIQTPNSRSLLFLFFLHELLMNFTNILKTIDTPKTESILKNLFRRFD